MGKRVLVTGLASFWGGRVADPNEKDDSTVALRELNAFLAKDDRIALGMVPIGDAWIQYHIQYYLYGLIFVIFDVEVLFLYPWAVVFRHVGVNALIEVVIFILILFIGLIYAWRRGALRWA